MNERYPYLPNRHREIDDGQKRAFVAKAREKAPYQGQEANAAELYTVGYYSDRKTVMIDIPVEIDRLDTIDDPTVYDGVRVLVTEEERIDDSRSIIKMRQYIIYVRDMIADYSETERVYDLEQDKWATPAFADPTPETVIDVVDTQKKLGLTTFTRERFDEVYDILDKLEDEKRI